MTQAAPRKRFDRRRRLAGRASFSAVYQARARKSRGPLILHSRPNELEHCRLGLSVGRRVGNAVTRNLIKRRLREAFRLHEADLPRPARGGYDIILGVRPHKPLPMARYAELLAALADEAHLLWQRRASRSDRDG
ncbi:MAG: ribonuclease P protein component [Phycisphaerales bacterium JB039]